MVTHSSILPWQLPWIEEPVGLQSTGSHKSQTGLSDRTTTSNEIQEYLEIDLTEPRPTHPPEAGPGKLPCFLREKKENLH